jgi:DNA polymerase-4
VFVLVPRRVIVHLDVDAFLASAEQAADPALRGRPVVVGGLPRDRGIVISSSYEARARGVRNGMRLREAHAVCPAAVFRRGDVHAAMALAERVWEIARRETPLVQVTSLDDAFLDLAGTEALRGPPRTVAERIRRAAREEVGFSVSLGIAESRVLARVAGDLSKPGGIREVPPGDGPAFLAPLPVAALPGVGHRTARLLESFRVETVGDLQRVPRALLEETFGRHHGGVLHDAARGRDSGPGWDGSDPVVPDAPPRSVSRETSLAADTADGRFLEGILHYLLDRAASECRARGLAARRVEVRLAYADFAGAHRSSVLPGPEDDARSIWPVARGLFRAVRERRVLVRRVGTTLSDLAPAGGRQAGLFTAEEEGRARRLAAAADRVRERHGFRALLAGPEIALLGKLELRDRGFVLRTPSLSR